MKIEKSAVIELVQAKIDYQRNMISIFQRNADACSNTGNVGAKMAYESLETEYTAVLTALTELLAEVEDVK